MNGTIVVYRRGVDFQEFLVKSAGQTSWQPRTDAHFSHFGLLKG
jgi:hypothetical protein